jgi:hypothetical protein
MALSVFVKEVLEVGTEFLFDQWIKIDRFYEALATPAL